MKTNINSKYEALQKRVEQLEAETRQLKQIISIATVDTELELGKFRAVFEEILSLYRCQ